jgi:hypothetical protein
MTSQLIAILADDLTDAADTAAGTLAAGPWVTWRRSEGTVAWHDANRIVAIDARNASGHGGRTRKREAAADLSASRLYPHA